MMLAALGVLSVGLSFWRRQRSRRGRSLEGEKPLEPAPTSDILGGVTVPPSLVAGALLFVLGEALVLLLLPWASVGKWLGARAFLAVAAALGALLVVLFFGRRRGGLG
jgi:NADH:ubiquinone oxidoreductase subunit 3 (subunit A)